MKAKVKKTVVKKKGAAPKTVTKTLMKKGGY